MATRELFSRQFYLQKNGSEAPILAVGEVLHTSSLEKPIEEV
jgi:hypothetical protein